jgi:hypothetical protein
MIIETYKKACTLQERLDGIEEARKRWECLGIADSLSCLLPASLPDELTPKLKPLFEVYKIAVCETLASEIARLQVEFSEL